MKQKGNDDSSNSEGESDITKESMSGRRISCKTKKNQNDQEEQ
jgi:hypothetical protein